MSSTAPKKGDPAASVGCPFARLPAWSSVAVRGADRQAFLHNFCTNDIKGLTAGTSCEAFFCNVKGRVIGHGLVTCRDDELIIIGAPGQGSSLAAHLDRYVIREDVAVRDVTTERACLLVFGGRIANEWAKLAGAGVADGAGMRPPFTNRAAQMDGTAVRWIEWPVAGPRSVILEMAVWELPRVEGWLEQHGGTRCERDALEAARIEAGMALFGVDFDDRNFPQEVGRDEQAISFTKGCYLGQETVARIDALGHVNRRLVGVCFHGSMLPEIGVELTHAGKQVGHVTSAAFSPKLGAPLALAMIRREQTAAGSQLDSPVGTCQVVTLPVT